MGQLNYEDLLQIDYKKNIVMIVFSLTIVILLIVSFNINAYFSKECEGIYDGKYVSVTLLYDNISLFETGDYLLIEKEKYDYEIISYDNVYSLGEYYYQTVYLKIEKDFLENEVVEFTVFYEEEKMIEKIIDLIF